MASSIALPTFRGPLIKSSFIGKNHFLGGRPSRSIFPVPKQASTFHLRPCAKFNLFEIMGGRGLCNGEQGLQEELKRNIEQQTSSTQERSGSNAPSKVESVPENGFEKELMGLTGGFPGGEKGLQQFIEKNPPPKTQSVVKSEKAVTLSTSKKPKPPELPLLMPGMIAIVKNPNNPYYMYCGIVQRITDGKAGVLFEGGNWDRLITFRLEELERREKGPPGKNPKSAVLEALVEKDSK